MRVSYRKAYEEVGATLGAEIFCAGCAVGLPSFDREGNERREVFLSDLDGLSGLCCDSCGSDCSTW